MGSSLTRRLFRRLRYPTFKKFASLVSICLWVGIVTLWSHSSGIKVEQEAARDEGPSTDIHSVFQKTFAHRTIEKWHLSDREGRVPLLFPLTNPKFSSYPEERLFSWSELRLNEVRCQEGTKLTINPKEKKLTEFEITLFMNFNLLRNKKEYFIFSQIHQHLCLCYLIFDISKNKQKTECHDYFHIKLGAN
jgi:hypothetical protein